MTSCDLTKESVGIDFPYWHPRSPAFSPVRKLGSLSGHTMAHASSLAGLARQYRSTESLCPLPRQCAPI
jgi:hypothetical protein